MVKLTLCGAPVQSTHEKFPVESRCHAIKVRPCVNDTLHCKHHDHNNITLAGEKKTAVNPPTPHTSQNKKKGLQRRKAQPCWCRRASAVLEPAPLQLTKQPSTQTLHNTRQRCNQSCCSLGLICMRSLAKHPLLFVTRAHKRVTVTPVTLVPLVLNAAVSAIDGLFMNLLPRKS